MPKTTNKTVVFFKGELPTSVMKQKLFLTVWKETPYLIFIIGFVVIQGNTVKSFGGWNGLNKTGDGFGGCFRAWLL